ncbi:MAG: TonB-dependent receptor [Pseudomonadota bacterium]|nr:TonB-dependent receptor [Pseudomonadota bacterium]
MKYRNSMGIAGALIGCGAVLCAPVAFGEEHASAPSGELYEIIVTAEKRETDLQHTPVAVGVIDGGEIETHGVTQLDDALKNMVGVVVAREARGLSPTIRGVGPTVPTGTAGGSAGVSSLFDGVYTQNPYEARLGYYDVARIEVLRGPQGTLYGRNSEGGVVGLISNDPSQKLEGSASVDVGNYSLLNATGMLNLPVSSALAVRVAAGSVDRKGYLSNGQDDNRAQGARAKLLFSPSDGFSLLLGAESTRLRGEGPGAVPAFAAAPSASVAYNNTLPSGQVYDINTYKTWAKLNANVGIGQLTILPAYQYQSEPKALLYGSVLLYSPGLGSLIERSVEARLASNPESPIAWVAGYYRYYSHLYQPDDYLTALDSFGDIIVAPGSVGAVSNTYSYEDSNGVFAQTTVPITERLRVIGGLRQSTDKKRELFVQGGPTPETEQRGRWSNSDWKAGGEFDVSARSMVYATVSTGYRPGGIAPSAGGVPGNAGAHKLYEPEKLRAYEIGSKNQFLDNTLRLNASFYYSDYKSYQLSTTQQCGPTLPTPCANRFRSFNNAIFNVPVKIRGAEIESQYLPTPNDSVTANVALQRSRIDESVLDASTQQYEVLSGDALPNSPKFMFNGLYRHTFHLPNGATIGPEISPRYQSASYVSVSRLARPLNAQAAWWQWDASLQYRPDGGAWSVSAYVKNATQAVVKTDYFDAITIRAPGVAIAIPTQVALQAPRTFGLSVTARF